jgi:hypothetical protein
MEGQDEMVNILTENAGANIKRTFGGLSVNGLFKMNDSYMDTVMTDTWTLFGDPSLMVRTADPEPLALTYAPAINPCATHFVVNCNADGALVCLTLNHEIIGTGTVTGGSANITFSQLTGIDTITICATKFNYIPYLGTVIINNNPPVAGFTYISNGLMLSFTDASVNAVSYSWNFGDGTTSTSKDPVHTYAGNGSYNVMLVSSNGCGSDTTYQDITVADNGINENNPAEIVSIYPNPSGQGVISILYKSENILQNLRIYNSLGQLITDVSNDNAVFSMNWNASLVDPGVYYLNFISEKKTIVRKLVITK